MSYVLILITVFSASNGVHSQTSYQEFASKAACEQAASAVVDAMRELKGTLGRDVIAQCHALK